MNTLNTMARCHERRRENAPLPREQHLMERIVKIQEEADEVAAHIDGWGTTDGPR